MTADGRGLAGIHIPEWTLDALCAETDPEIFFQPKGGSQAPAKAICARCTVAAECLDYALAYETEAIHTREERSEPYGIWGGLGPKERKRLIRAARTETTDHADRGTTPRATSRGKRNDALAETRAKTTAILDRHGVTPAQVRAWARANDVECPDTGALPLRVAEQYDRTVSTPSAHTDDAADGAA